VRVFVAYYRVSTDRQRASGLGLEAQRESVARHIGLGGRIIAEYTETESGKQHKNRPQLAAALDTCRKHRAVLVIAKLDRLGRNVAFISALMESSVEFVCCDNPHATRLLLHMLAAFAEHEREMISERTKSALAAAKARGVRLGNPRLEAARVLARASHHASRPAPEVLALILNWRAQGATLREIADRLNRLNIRPARGRAWYGSSVNSQIAAATISRENGVI
jgi:DNA invertase Pin-like site-specific DNA recombinase